MLIFMLIGVVLMIGTGLFLSSYELKRAKRARLELRERARRCVRGR